MMFKRVNGKLMVIERHFYVFFSLAVAVGMLITIAIVEVDARSEDEPQCYSSSCEKRFGSESEDQPTTEYEEIQEQKETEMDAINDEMKRVIKEKAEAEKEIEKLEIEIPKLKIDLLAQENVERLSGHEHMGMVSILKQMKKDYRDAYDSAETIEEIDAAKQLKVEYVNYENKYNLALEKENKEHAKTVELEDKIEEKEDELDEQRELVIELDEELDQLRLDMFKAQRNDQFIAIRLSGTCEMLIKNGYPHKCPTYQELVPMFDNTDERISGAFYFDEEKNDLNRERSQLQNYERYYEQVPSWLVITVDPDARMMQKAALIEIAPNRVHWVCGVNDAACDIPADFGQNERYIQYDIHIDKYCTHALVSPDINVIGDAVNQFLDACQQPNDEWRKIITLPIYGDVRIYNHGWINDILRSAGVE